MDSLLDGRAGSRQRVRPWSMARGRPQEQDGHTRCGKGCVPLERRLRASAGPRSSRAASGPPPRHADRPHRRPSSHRHRPGGGGGAAAALGRRRALGMGGGGGFMTGRGQANVLTRATAILAALFFATSLGLTLLARYGHPNQLNFNVSAGPAEKGPGAAAQGAGQRARSGARHRAAARRRWCSPGFGTRAGRPRAPPRRVPALRPPRRRPSPAACPSARTRRRPRQRRRSRHRRPLPLRQISRSSRRDAPQQSVDGMARRRLALPKLGESL